MWIVDRKISDNQASKTEKVGRITNLIHVISVIDKKGNVCYTDCSTAFRTANIIAKEAVKARRAKSYRIDSFKPKVVGYGITWLEFERVEL